MENTFVRWTNGALAWPTAVPFVRAPVPGEWIAAPSGGWSRVLYVTHAWAQATPILTAVIGQPEQQAH
jgi:hypothetical protein